MVWVKGWLCETIHLQSLSSCQSILTELDPVEGSPSLLKFSLEVALPSTESINCDIKGRSALKKEIKAKERRSFTSGSDYLPSESADYEQI